MYHSELYFFDNILLLVCNLFWL